MEEIFCDFKYFFPKPQEEDAGQQRNARKRQEERCCLPGKPAPRGPQKQEIHKAPQAHAQGHKEPQPPCPRHTAQQKEQAGKKAAEEQIPRQGQFFQPKAPPHFPHQIVDQPQGRAAGQTQQCLQPLYAGIDLHQPRIRPRMPRRGWALSL